MVEIRQCKAQEIIDSPNINALLNEYSQESSLSEIGPPAAQFPVYLQLEEMGVLHVIGAFQSNELIGFVTILISPLPHYGQKVATSESLFVASAARKTGAGLKLIWAAEALAKKQGATAFLLSAPEGGQLVEVMRGRRDWRPSNRVFVKDLG